MILRNFPIGSRLALGFGAILLATSSVLAWVSVSSDRARGELLRTLQQASSQEREAVAMRDALLSSAVAVRNMGLQTKIEAVQHDEATAHRQTAAYLAAKERLRSTGLTVDEKALFERLTKIDLEMAADLKEAADLSATFNAEQSAAIITGRIDPLLDKAVVEIGNFIALQRAHTDAATAAADDANRLRQRLASAVGAAVLLFGALVAWRLTISITVPLRSAVRAAARVAEGDLHSEILVHGRDEAAQLLRGLADMRDSLARMVNEVRAGTEALDSASTEIAVGNADLSSRTESQASALQQAASSVGELTSAVKQNAQSALQAQTLSQSAAEQTDKGHAAVGRVVHTMTDIDDSSRKIGAITSVINGIAFQTNILALNAAVEAARAGEHGRGFAVVASEVRTLSQRTTQAAHEIDALIRVAVERTQAGSQLVGEAGASMQGVLHSVREVARIIAEISRASGTQTAGIEQVNLTITDIDRSTQQNAALVEQVSAAADSMRDQTRRLSGTVAQFRA